MHQKVHMMPGMLGSLDVTKVHWKNCPTALKGQFQGKEKYASIALESVVDYNLWFWHASFGFPGTLNDINIWERSTLLESMLNGQHDDIDHEFVLDGEVFTKLFYLVDGIYPSLTRFLGPENDLATELDGSYKIDQEGSRKDVERGYGVLKLKFLALSHPITLHHRDDIYYMVLATILLHNMMVKERIDDEEVEDGSFYDTTMDANSNEEDEQVTEEVSDRDDVEYSRYDQNVIDRRYKAQLIHKRWKELYDNDGSKKLKDAMKRHLYKNKFGVEAFQSSHAVMKDYNPLSF